MKLTELLNFEKKPVLGLDIGSHSVKVVQLSMTDGKYSVKYYANVEITHSETADNNEQQRIIEAIHKAVDQITGKALYAVSAVNGTSVTVRNFSFPSTSRDKIASAILREVEEVCPLDIKQSIIDYQLIDSTNGSDRISGLSIAS